MKLPAPDAVWPLPTKHLGERVCVYDQLASTNSLALQVSRRPTGWPLMILACAQTAGRGQYGRTWHAPPGSSVLLSVLLFPPAHLRQPVLLTAWAAVAVCETIRALSDLAATIKWPNDVLIAGKKVCGILIEQRTTSDPGFPLATVAGIGLNVSQSAEMFAEANLPDAASLASTSGQSFSYEHVAKELIRQLDQHYHRLHGGDRHTLESLWQDRLGLADQTVFVETTNGGIRGRLLEVTFAGLEIQVNAETVRRVPPEMVRHVHAIDACAFAQRSGE